MSRRQPTSLFHYVLPLVLPLLPTAMASSSAPSTLPQVDFSKMGTVGLGGSFEGLDWWTSNSPFGSSSSTASSSSSSYSSTGDTLLYTSGDGSIRPVGSTNAGGKINSICWANTTDTNGTIYVGGSFTSIGSASTSNIALYSISTSTWSGLSNGIDGAIDTLYCDNAYNQVWIGGSFVSPSTGSNVALWSTSSSTWKSVPFQGLNGPVQDIYPSNNGSSIYFAGYFTTLFQSNSSSNSTTNNITSVPSAPTNTSTIGNSGYLTPVTLPPLSSSSGNLTITAGPSTDQSKYSDPEVLLCPGSGTWLAEDNTVASVDVMGYNYFRAVGARVTNGLVEGRGATSFCITSLPDNTQLNMTYTDLTTGKNTTCWEHCPLYTNASIGAQDFIFTDGPRNLTGLQMQLKTWIGDGAGLSSVQLLSDGAYGSAVNASNAQSCGSANASSAQITGDWHTKSFPTDIPATTSYYLQTSVPVSDPTYPSVTFYPFVSSAGYYNVYMLIPGCVETQDCDSRTTVDVEVFPQNGGLGWTSTISEQVQQDTSTLIYSGPVDATTSAFSPTIILALAQNPASVTSNHYSVVAQAVQLTFTGTTGSTASGGVNSTTSANSTSTSQNSSHSTSFGLFEYPRSSNVTINAASAVLSNTTETALSKLGFALDKAFNSSTSRTNWTVNALAATGTTVYVAGSFASMANYTNVVSVDTTSSQVTPLASQGLNGIVNTAVVLGQYIYFGGAFTSTASGGTTLKYLARYDPGSKSWASIGGGVDGQVLELVVSGSNLLVFGNFTHTIASDGTTTQTGGYGVWDTSSSSWTSGSVLFGSVSTGAISAQSTFMAGRVLGSSSNPVNGIAFLSTGNNGAQISTLSGVSFASTGSSLSRRSLDSKSFNFRSSQPEGRATAPSIPLQITTAPAVLAGAFYQNGSNAITILGGNFSTSNGIGALGFYDNNALTAPSSPVSGVVRALAVMGNTLYAAGSNVSVSGGGSGLVAYTLPTGSWINGGIPALAASSGTSLLVSILKQRPNSNTLIAAGNFATAGSLGCAGVCLWDTVNGQWSAPGTGLSSGEVRSIDFADVSPNRLDLAYNQDSYDVMIAAGSFVLSSGTTSYVASYSFANSTWTNLGSLAGPALAVAVDNKNASNIFAAGYSTDGTPYLSQWNGETWTTQNNSLQAGSIVSSLAFVPMTSTHSAVGSIESDRMLMVSGQLYLAGYGNVTSALYDGAVWYPYLVGTSSTGSAGAASSFFWSESSFSFNIAHYLARGLVVLVAIAIATGLILLLVLLFLLIAYLLRRKERRRPVHSEIFNKDPDTSTVSSTHQNVFNNVQAALEQTLRGAGAGTAIAAAGRRSRDSMNSMYNDHHPAGAGIEEESSGDEEEEEEGRETTMRYDFDGPDLQPGEMSMKAGQRVVILDDTQSDEWWYARDPASGREGVVPATYVW